MKYKALLISALLIISLTACANPTESEPSVSVSESITNPTSENSIVSDAGESEPIDIVESIEPSEQPASSKVPDSTVGGNDNQASTSKETNPPATSQTPTTQPPITVPPASSTPSEPPTITPPPSPQYEVLGQAYLNEVLSGINDRRAEMGLPLAHIDNDLSNECLVGAKKMAESGKAFHSENPRGCEGVSKVPYKYPGNTLGNVMCSHVPNFLDEHRVSVGIAVVKSGNYLFAVVQGI